MGGICFPVLPKDEESRHSQLDRVPPPRLLKAPGAVAVDMIGTGEMPMDHGLGH